MDAPHAKADEQGEDPASETRAPRRERLRDDPERAARWAAWRAENAAAIESWNGWVEEHGLPLERYRIF